MNVGLVGYGRFGRLAARYIAKRARVYVFDALSGRKTESRRIIRSSLANVASQPIVLLAVPTSALKETLYAIAPHLVPGALVMDACAVKRIPAAWMKRILPRTATIIGAHPFFGPDSARMSLRGHHIVLCPVRTTRRRLNSVARVLRQEGLIVSLMSPASHDRLVAETILLTQYVGRLLALSGLRRQKLVTRNYHALLSLREVAEHDSVQLFVDMVKFNPWGKRVVQAIGRATRLLAREVK